MNRPLYLTVWAAVFLFVVALCYVRIVRGSLVSPCHEDEALVWIDAPTTAACVPLDGGPRRIVGTY